MSRKRVSDQLLLQTILLNPGATDHEVGEMLGLSRVQVSRRKNNPEFKVLLRREYNDALEVLRSYRGRAARRIAEICESRDERIAFKAAEYLLEKVEVDDSKSDQSDEVWAEINARVTKILAEGD